MTKIHNYLLIALTMLQPQCSDELSEKASSKEPVEVEKDGFIPQVDSKVPAKESLSILQKFLKATQENPETYRDIEEVLKARSLEESGASPAKIQSQWRQAMTFCQKGGLSKVAFDGWVLAYSKAFNKTMDPEVMAKLILAETQQGQASAYMLQEGLTTQKPLIKVLKKIVGPWLAPTPAFQLAKAPQGLPPNDPLLTETAQKSCKGSSLDLTSWAGWKNMLSPPVIEYFEGLVAQCSKDTNTAMDKLASAAVKLAKEESISSQSMALEAYSRLAVLQRASGQRREAADTYRSMMGLWENNLISPESLGSSAFVYYKRKINDSLWACRYRALISDYEQAKIYGQKALSISQQGLTMVPSLSGSERVELEDLKAEAYHTLANRIAVELKQWESAASLNLLALESSNLSAEWRNRVLWLAGLYDYIGGNYAKAKNHWNQYLNGNPDPSQIPMTLFWLARTDEKLGNTDSRDVQINNLIKKYPLSFYSTSGLLASKILSDKEIKENLSQIFGEPEALKKETFYRGSVSMLKPRQTLINDNRFRASVIKSELFYRLKNQEYAQIAAKDFEQIVKKHDQEGTLQASVEEAAWVFSSRLYYAAHNYLKTITITHKQSLQTLLFWQRWPDHLPVFFPAPYLEFYKDSAEDNQVDFETLLGISRQESAFTPMIESSAGALGLMQLIRPTGKKFAKELGYKINDIEELLNDPKTNIKLGSRYIRTLGKHYNGNTPAIFAGYNAGEIAVDQWIKRRFHSDPLVFIELIPFGETKDYVKNVWRNQYVYSYLHRSSSKLRLSANP
jgi:tetratricopeptide (TPR) repeat protein